MKFSQYIKQCRTRYKLTQEQLSEELYIFDESFIGVDSRTISRWEHAQTKPSIERIISIIRFFQSKSGVVLPCFDNLDRTAIENEICKVGIKNLIGSSKEHILNYPSKLFTVEDITITHLRSKTDITLALELPVDVMQNLSGGAFSFSKEQLQKLALHPSNIFLLSEYKQNFAGMFFVLYLRQDVFEKLMQFEITIKDLTVDDIADTNEEGCSVPLTFFALNDKTATLLILRYYAYLIANQQYIVSVGTTPLLESGKKIVQKMHLQRFQEKQTKYGTITSYKASLDTVLVNKSLVKILFQKQNCPKDSI